MFSKCIRCSNWNKRDWYQISIRSNSAYLDYNNGDTMRYTEKKQDLEIATNSGFLRTLFLKVLRSPYTIVSEMGMKIPFLEKRILERILIVAILIATAIVAVTCLIRIRANSFSLTVGTMPLIFMLGGLLVLIAMYFVLICFNMKIYRQMDKLVPSYADETEVEEDLEDLSETTKDTHVPEKDEEEEEDVKDLLEEDKDEADPMEVTDFNELEFDTLGDIAIDDISDKLQNFDDEDEDEDEEEPIDSLAQKPASSLDGCDEVLNYQNRNQTFIENFLGKTIGNISDDKQKELLNEIERNEGTLSMSLEELARIDSVTDDFDNDDLNTWDIPENFGLTA